jgi:hypothetical protein
VLIFISVDHVSDPPEEIDSDIDDHSVTDEKEGVKSGPPPGALLVNLTCFGCRVSKVRTFCGSKGNLSHRRAHLVSAVVGTRYV